MRPLNVLARTLPLALAGLLAGCGGPDAIEPPSLTPAQVQGVYAVCSLRFSPDQTALPTADVLQTVVNTAPPAPKQPPSLTLSGQTAEYQLVYTRKSDNFLQQLSGHVSFSPTTVFLDFPDAAQSETVRELLLPATLMLDFNGASRRLTALPLGSYGVRRADYAKAAGITETGLQPTLTGQMAATFSASGC